MPQPFSLQEIQNLPLSPLSKPKFITASDGIQLAYYPFMPINNPPTQSIIIFYHGSGLYTNHAYQWVGAELQKTYNLGCYMVDIRGHGHSQGKRGDTSSIEQVWHDVDTIINVVRLNHPHARIYLAGHSSGSSLLLNYNSYKKESIIAGYLFIAPYLGPSAGVTKHALDAPENFVKKVHTWIFTLNRMVNLSVLQHIPAIYFNYPSEYLHQDPLIVPYRTYALSCALTPMQPQQQFAQLHKPFTLFIGENDEQFIAEKVVKYAQYATHTSQKSFAKIIPNTAHISILLKTPELIAQALTVLS